MKLNILHIWLRIQLTKGFTFGGGGDGWGGFTNAIGRELTVAVVVVGVDAFVGRAVLLSDNWRCWLVEVVVEWVLGTALLDVVVVVVVVAVVIVVANTPGLVMVIHSFVLLIILAVTFTVFLSCKYVMRSSLNLHYSWNYIL